MWTMSNFTESLNSLRTAVSANGDCEIVLACGNRRPSGNELNINSSETEFQVAKLVQN